MKVKDVENSLGLMENLIEEIKNIPQIKDLVGYYDFLKKNSGYFFSDDEPDDLSKMLNGFMGDIQTIRNDIAEKVIDNGQDLEV